MRNDIKIISFYLPQFHEIKENNEWWGNGFTEWTNVKKATPLFNNHYQPRIPLNENYYDLSNADNILWQARLANKYGIDGFCIYHYWFNGHMLLEKPVELLLENKEIDISFCFCWANESWTNAWVSKENKVLIEQTYGDKNEWREHFYYFLKFFKDSRYIQDDNKPLLVIYRPEIIPCLNEMLDYWSELAIENGFNGMKYAYQQSGLDDLKGDDSRFDYNIEYQPKYAIRDINNKSIIKRELLKIVDILNNTLFKNHIIQKNKKEVTQLDYDLVWKHVIEHRPANNKCIAGAFVDWDNTPRRGSNGLVIQGATPEKFEKYLFKQLKNVKLKYSTSYLFVFAWNEWAEGGYLEPDQKYTYQYLDAIRKAKKI